MLLRELRVSVVKQRRGAYGSLPVILEAVLVSGFLWVWGATALSCAAGRCKRCDTRITQGLVLPATES